MDNRGKEGFFRFFLLFSALSAVLILVLLFFFLVKESLLFFSRYDVLSFIAGVVWSPSTGVYGAAVFIVNSIYITFGALLIAAPLGLSCAIFLSEIAPLWVSRVVRPVIELLAGIPSVVYGLFGLVVVVGFVQFDVGVLFTGSPMSTGKGFLAVSMILAVMVLPVIISVSQDAMEAVPYSYREGSYALGSTRWQTIKGVVLPAASSGIFAGVILAVGRVVGETMAVVLLFGNVKKVVSAVIGPASRGEALTSAVLLEMSYAVVGSMHYSALFALGLVLFVFVLVLSVFSEHLASKTK